MHKIAILSCAKSAATCCGIDCLRFFADRERSFAPYAGQELRLAGFTLCSGCDADPRTDEAFAGKIAHFIKVGVQEVHVSACVTSAKKNCPRKDAMFEALESAGLKIRRLEKQE